MGNELTVKQQLLKLGMKENEIDNHASDLYVLKNDISKEFISTYDFKNNVTIFRSQIDNKLWYEIPFVFTEEYYNNRQ